PPSPGALAVPALRLSARHPLPAGLDALLVDVPDGPAVRRRGAEALDGRLPDADLRSRSAAGDGAQGARVGQAAPGAIRHHAARADPVATAQRLLPYRGQRDGRRSERGAESPGAGAGPGSAADRVGLAPRSDLREPRGG